MNQGLNINLKGSDANLEGRTIQWPDSDRYFTGLEVFHSLHCLVSTERLDDDMLREIEQLRYRRSRTDFVKQYIPTTTTSSTIRTTHLVKII